MAQTTDRQLAQRCDFAAWIITGVALVLTLKLHLLAALLSGLLIYELVLALAPRLHIVRIQRRRAKLVAVGLLASAIIVVLALSILGLVVFIRSEAGSVPALLQKMADILDTWRTTMPTWVVEYLPGDVDELKGQSVEWLRAHAGFLQHAGTEAGRALAHILLGLVVGALVALHDVQRPETLGPLAHAFGERVSKLGEAFRRVVFGQVRISAINTIVTGLYLVVALPIAGIHLPFAKTMIAVVFLVGLLPVIGNLISNTIIVVLSLSVSLKIAIISLVFLVVIHKLEYFLNAHIVGTQVRAHAWELLLAMLLMEAAFGISGLIAAPIYYAYLKDELVSRKLI
jgi:predicted PurR-regulated permease PerM